jgi:GH25 family lysozyme M1 (1,4-beta-N-acetylmuramidase)
MNRIMSSQPRRTGLAVLMAAATLLVTVLTCTPASAATVTYGQDVSGSQGSVDWPAQWSAGSRFAYIKATEGDYYLNPSFMKQYDGSYRAGMIRGAYHFANPNRSGGSAQADYFLAHGGRWFADGRTLPGALDIEYNPYGSICYGMSQSAMVGWISAFLHRYRSRTGRWAVIYTTTRWWRTCTGNYRGFWGHSPLWLARYARTPGTLPAGARTWSFWQYSSRGPYAGDSNRWHGSLKRLKALAAG